MPFQEKTLLCLKVPILFKSPKVIENFSSKTAVSTFNLKQETMVAEVYQYDCTV